MLAAGGRSAPRVAGCRFDATLYPAEGSVSANVGVGGFVIHPTTAGADGDVGAFTPLPGWAVRVDLATCYLSPEARLCRAKR